jgi:branched-chain amino acid transport system permease protein
LSAYVLSAVLCGIAGFLLANLNAFASPNTLAWTVSGDLIVMVVLGGIGSIFGPLLGALAFLGLEEILKSFTQYWLVIFGPIVLLMALVGKRGIAGLLAAAERKADPEIKNVASAAPLAQPRPEGSI